MFLGVPDPEVDPLVRGMDSDPDPTLAPDPALDSDSDPSMIHSGTGLIYEMVLVKKLTLEASGHECRKQFS
jgi:hypothetical protein